MHSRQANATIYLQEELSDARLRCDELKNYVTRALELVHASKYRDHLYAVAGDIIYGMPEALLKLERALQATAMGLNKIDYEELRQVLRPEKVDELERVLEEVRMYIPRRTGKLELESIPQEGKHSASNYDVSPPIRQTPSVWDEFDISNDYNYEHAMLTLADK